MRDWDDWKYNEASAEEGISDALMPYLEKLARMADASAVSLREKRHKGWVAEKTSKLVQDGLIEYALRRPDGQLPAKGTPLKQQAECTAASASSSALQVQSMDALFMTTKQVQQQPQSPQQQQQQQREQPSTSPAEVLPGKAVCICKMETPTFLMEPPVSSNQPKNLIQGCEQLDRPAQLIAALYDASLIVFCVVQESGLLVSQPSSHRTASTSASPAATSLGAMMYSQQNGLRTHEDPVQDCSLDELPTVEELIQSAYLVTPPSERKPFKDGSDDKDCKPR